MTSVDSNSNNNGNYGCTAAAIQRYPATHKVFVGSLPPSMTAAALRAAFVQFGPVEAVHISVHRVTGVPRGYGFVAFRDADGAAVALANRFVTVGGGSGAVGGAVVEVRAAAPVRFARGASSVAAARLASLGNTALYEQDRQQEAAAATAPAAPTIDMAALEAMAAEWEARAAAAAASILGAAAVAAAATVELPPVAPPGEVAAQFWVLWWPPAAAMQ